jgi:hypothetical protein
MIHKRVWFRLVRLREDEGDKALASYAAATPHRLDRRGALAADGSSAGPTVSVWNYFHFERGRAPELSFSVKSDPPPLSLAGIGESVQLRAEGSANLFLVEKEHGVQHRPRRRPIDRIILRQPRLGSGIGR